MAERASNFVGNSNIEYGVLWNNNHQERKRSTTDVAALIIYGMFIVAWIGIVIYAYSHSRVPPFEFVGLEMKFLWTSPFFSPAIFFFSWFCILLIVFYFIMLRWCTKFTVYLTIFLEFLLITVPLITLACARPDIAIPILMVFYLIFWIEIQILRKVDIYFICKIITDACKASIAFPSSLFIVLLYLVSTFLFLTFDLTVIYCLANPERTVIKKQRLYEHFPNQYEHFPSQYEHFPNQYEHFPNQYGHFPDQYTLSSRYYYKDIEEMCETPVNIGLIVTFVLLSFWILIVDSLCMLSVLHGMFANWCRMTNKSVIPKFTIALRYWFYAYRYHIGSFAFMSMPFVPIIQVIRTICTNIHMLEVKIKESPYNIYCTLVIIGNILSNTSIASASYGKCFYPSMKDAFKVLIQNPMKFTAARLIIAGMIFFGLTLILSIMIGVVSLHIAIWNPIDYGMYLLATGCISLLITTSILCIFSAAVDSVLFCHLEEFLKKNEVHAGEDPENN